MDQIYPLTRISNLLAQSAIPVEVIARLHLTAWAFCAA